MLCPDPSDRINSFAVVAYLRGPLAEFIDSLRAELVSGCVSHAHVTILPPRPLNAEVEAAAGLITRRVADFAAFPVEAIGIRVFPVTQVIYADIGAGAQELRNLHRMLNVDELHFDEPFEYHPHLTLAQGLEPEGVDGLYELAGRRWTEFERRHSREFAVGTLTFVQNTGGNRWIDLAEWELRSPAGVYSR
jgi:2'-5' RNA ligase